MSRLKIVFFHIAKFAGLFHLSRYLMRNRLLILCFHGIALSDEAAFRPMLFMRDTLFRERLQTLKRYRFPVLPLGDALEQLKKRQLHENAVVITIDDGFYNALSRAAPALQEYQLPATLYLTSYYVKKDTPIFRLVVQYMFWKTTESELPPVDLPWSPTEPVPLDDKPRLDAVMWQIIEYGEQAGSEEQRQVISQRLGELLQVDYAEIVESRILGLLRPDELSQLEQMGVDVQLHTHRHRLPPGDSLTCHAEVQENRAFIRNVLDSDKHHLCYPSGEWDDRLWSCLEKEGVQSATTCEPGLNTAKTPPLRLYRILDQDDLTPIEFEAELFGFCELIRVLTGKRKDP